MSDTITSDRERADTIGDDHDKQAGGHGIQRSTGTPGANPPSRRKRLLALLGLAVASAGAVYGAYYYSYARFYESTDDAYVSGNLGQLT